VGVPPRPECGNGPHPRDDAVQGRIAADVLSAGDVFVPKTVILELEWVLRYVADQPEDKVLDCLAHLIALPGITVEDRDEIEAALGHCRNGIDFADALHLAASKSCSELLTFDDRGYARRGLELGRCDAAGVTTNAVVGETKKLRLKPPVRVPTAKQQIPRRTRPADS